MVGNVEFHIEMDFQDAKIKIHIDTINGTEEIPTSRTVRMSSKPYFAS